MKRFEITIRHAQTDEFEDLFNVTAADENDALMKVDRYGYSQFVYSVYVKELND